ncbi:MULTISPECIES: hypothetical protein [Micrococcaceae]|uniref:hypothetical protein n=1 Tax=Micrococcaceae TaxID=1268 RepID=UPI00047EB734|nr:MULTISPECIES: hypothetical protein [Micrococcaceae]BCW57714.1 hypothetical protein StoSoilB20_10610 [Arthrobacter sp. StoSoilB20]
MPYQGTTTPADSSDPAISKPTAPVASTVAVIPAVDLFLGTVTIVAKAGTAKFRHPQPHLIAGALARAVRPTRWCGPTRTLTVTVAAVGQRAGAQQHYTLTDQDPS